MDNLVFLVVLDESGDMLDRPPACNVPVVALAEYAIQQASRAEQSDMASMQRRDRSPSGYLFVWSEKRHDLLPRTGVRQQVFEQVVGQATVTESRFACRWHSIWFAGIGSQLRQLLIAAVEANALQQALIRVNGRAAYVLSYAEHGDLAEAH